MSNLTQVERVTQPETSPLQRGLHRSVTARVIAQTLLSQWCHEEGTPLQRLTDLDPLEAKRFNDAAEFITHLVLSPERFEAALMCMADVICLGSETNRGIEDYPRKVQARYYHLAVSALHALQENVKDVPPDRAYRDEMCRLVDAVVPKPQANTQVHPIFRNILNAITSKGGVA